MLKDHYQRRLAARHRSIANHEWRRRFQRKNRYSADCITTLANRVESIGIWIAGVGVVLLLANVFGLWP